MSTITMVIFTYLKKMQFHYAIYWSHFNCTISHYKLSETPRNSINIHILSTIYEQSVFSVPVRPTMVVLVLMLTMARVQ